MPAVPVASHTYFLQPETVPVLQLAIVAASGANVSAHESHEEIAEPLDVHVPQFVLCPVIPPPLSVLQLQQAVYGPLPLSFPTNPVLHAEHLRVVLQVYVLQLAIAVLDVHVVIVDASGANPSRH